MIDALPLLLGDDGYQISRSVRLRSSASAYFNRTPASAGNRKTWTWSGWVKRGALGSNFTLFSAGSGSAVDTNWLGFLSSDVLAYSIQDGTYFLSTTQVFRDPSAWYHVILATDTTQATASNRAKIYINGVQVTAFSSATYAVQNLDQLIGAANLTTVGAKYRTAVQDYFDGYLTEINFIDGYPTGVDQGTWASFWGTTCPLFGETNPVTGVWQPKKYTGTYGTNGFYLNFSDNSAATASAIGKDYSGNGNNWTPNNISVTAGVTYDSMLDVPTQWADGGNGRGNYSTMNPLDYVAAAFSGTASNGNLTISIPAPTNSNGLASTIRVVSAAQPKFYIETTITALNTVCSLGMISGTNANYRLRHTADITLAVNDVVMTAFDPATGNVWYGRNGTWLSSGNPSAGTNPFSTIPADQVVGSAYSILATNGSTGTFTTSTTFGQQPFTYTPPSGFKALNTLNLPTPTILKGNQYFDVVLYTGNAVQDRAVTGFGFDLDLAWIKSRNNAGSHVLVNREVGGDKQLFSNLTNAEQTNSDVTNGFTTGGILVGDNLTGTGSTNQNTYTYALWGWKEGATQGFDIVTGTSPASGNFNVSHSLGVAPAMIILKDRTNAGTAWGVWHRSLANPAQSFLQLNNTNAVAANANIWGNTAPTSTQFTTQSGQVVLGSANFVAYLFAEVAGFSKFGSYIANANADGPFVYLGFRARFVLWKNATTGSTNWFLWDTARGTNNVVGPELYPNLSSTEATATRLDINANGFKMRNGAEQLSGDTVIYAAFAENPFKNALAR